MKAIIRDAKHAWVKCFDAFLNFCFRAVSGGLDREIARRAAQRDRGYFHWITPDDAVVAEALANLIVPPDDEGPGIEDVGVLGPTALEALDQLIAGSLERQTSYGRGLVAFDIWAQRDHGCKFAAMAQGDQTRLLSAAECVYKEWSSPAPLVHKAWRRFNLVIRGKGVPFSAGQLFPQIRSDCLQVFYTSRVSWMWLEYDGPPMDKGYPRLLARNIQ